MLAEEKSRQQRGSLPFEVKFFFFVCMVLSWPVSISLELYFKPSMYYWFGNWEILLSLGVIVWVLGMYMLLVSRLMSRTMAFVMMLVLPCSAFAISCGLQDLHFNAMSASLVSTDCSANPHKAYIEEAWRKAEEVSDNCNLGLMNVTGASLEETRKVRNFRNCPNYFKAEEKYPAEFHYLESLERLYLCGGWCKPNHPLWMPAITPLDGCATAAGLGVRSSIGQMGLQVACYSFVVLCGVALWLLLAPKSMIEG